MANWFAVHALVIVESASEIVVYEEVIELTNAVETATYDATETVANAMGIASERPLDVMEIGAQWNVMEIENAETVYATGT